MNQSVSHKRTSPMYVEKLEAKQSYQHRVETKLGKLNTQIVELKVKVAQIKVSANKSRYDKVAALSARQQEAQTKLQQLKSADEEAWQGFKVGMESAMHELQDAFNGALAQFKQSQVPEAEPYST